MNEYEAKIDPDTFYALICDCYRNIHPPFRKEIIDDHIIQVPYHYGEDWEGNNRELRRIRKMRLGQI